jgi:hypothetical protein
MPLEVFSIRERAQFTALPDAERQEVFFESWARKEACLKALGTGFILPPTHFEFDLSIRGDTTPRFRRRRSGGSKALAHLRPVIQSDLRGSGGGPTHGLVDCRNELTDGVHIRETAPARNQDGRILTQCWNKPDRPDAVAPRAAPNTNRLPMPSKQLALSRRCVCGRRLQRKSRSNTAHDALHLLAPQWSGLAAIVSSSERRSCMACGIRPPATFLV